MDFLKTLLAYMALLTTLSVQEGPLPQDAPRPTPGPTSAIVTEAPFQTEVPTATPSPTPGPVPQVTANSRYETVRYQDRGNAVRRLQNRLIELGYMPAGSADGAYGYQTYNAVRDFQRANGLDADGVAGPATQTYLYENEGVLPKLVATEAPTATPTPTLPPIPTPKPVPETPTPTPTATPPAATIVPPMDLGDIALPEVQATEEPFVLTEVPDALIISGNTGTALVITQLVDGVGVPLKPGLWTNAAGEPVVSLRDLVDCYVGWSLTGSAAEGIFTMKAAGYEVKLMLAGDSVRVTSDGRSVTLKENDVRYENGVIYVTGKFLQKTLDARVIFEEEEHSLVLFIWDKSMAEATD